MAFQIKDIKRPTGSSGRQAVLSQYIQVRQASSTGGGIALPASTTGQLFRVKGGRVLVRGIVGTVQGTAIQGTDPVLTVLSKQLDAASAAVGTAVTIATTVDVSSLEIGGSIVVPGTGGALVKANAGAAVAAAGVFADMILPQGEVYLNTTATKTGLVYWDMWYQPLDSGAFVEPATLTGGLLTVAI